MDQSGLAIQFADSIQMLKSVLSLVWYLQFEGFKF